jgi:hypothetical protein
LKNTRADFLPRGIIIGKVTPLAREEIRSWVFERKKTTEQTLLLFYDEKQLCLAGAEPALQIETDR